jgi:hypothetical protein
MTQLEELKDAMHSPPDFEPASLDLAQVMTAGGRMRRRRRFAVGGASALTVAALLIGGQQLAGLGGPAGGTQVAGQPAASAPAGPLPPMPSTGNSSAPGILGKVVETGRQLGGRQWILYVETTDPDDLDSTLTLVLGLTKTRTIDDFSIAIVSSDPGAGRMKPGFHAVEAGRLHNGRTTPTFGYHVGGAARITARDAATGRTVEARLAEWRGFAKADQMQIFWFDFTQGQTPPALTDLTAYDRNGAELRTGG